MFLCRMYEKYYIRKYFQGVSKMITRKNKRNAKIGVFAVAHATYWGQFEG